MSAIARPADDKAEQLLARAVSLETDAPQISAEGAEISRWPGSLAYSDSTISSTPEHR